MKLNYFTDDSPTNYCADDNMKHLYFKDYKHLTGVKWQVDTEPLSHKIIASAGFIMFLLVILFI